VVAGLVLATIAVASWGILVVPAAKTEVLWSRPPQELVYVANADSAPVTAYKASSTGAVNRLADAASYLPGEGRQPNSCQRK
jgi:hypothetical protein